MKPSKVIISSSGSLQQLWLSASPSAFPISPREARQQRTLHTDRSNSARRRRSADPEFKCLYCQCISPRVSQRRSAHTTSSSEDKSNLYWPNLPSDKQTTPYDILSHPQSGPYNKRRFNQLVKLYHPDSPSPSPAPSGHPCTLPQKIRLQRYHLLIQAHTLLSTPNLREAYDRHGAGWASTPSIDDLRRENSSRGWAAARDFRKATPSHCATWEDWEEWWTAEARRREKEDAGIFHHDFSRQDSPQARAERQAWWVSWVHEQNRWKPSGQQHQQRTAGFYSSNNNIPRQVPLYTSNITFILLVATCSLGGIIYELHRAGKNSVSMLAQLEARNQESWGNLARSRKESRELESREERVGRFLKDRGDDAVFGRGVYGKVLEAEEEARRGSGKGEYIQ